jgi:hypothetical protein
MRRVLFVVTLLMLIISACGAQAASTEGTAIIVEQPTPTLVRGDLTWKQSLLVSRLSKELSLPVDQIVVASTEAVDWPNGCLGIQKMGVMCTQGIVPGYRFILEANGKQYEFHTNKDMTVILPVEAPAAAGAAEQMVIKQLAANLDLPESDISVVSSADVEFPDSCLGVAMPDIMCAQMVTPGRIIVLQAKGVQYEYHVTGEGDRIQPATLALIWKREGGIAGFCDSLTVFLSGEVYANRCKPESEGRMGTFKNLFSSSEQSQFAQWVSELGQVNLDASDPAGVADRMVVTLSLFGQGNKQPSSSEQQTLFDFAQKLYQKLYS